MSPQRVSIPPSGQYGTVMQKKHRQKVQQLRGSRMIQHSQRNKRPHLQDLLGLFKTVIEMAVVRAKCIWHKTLQLYQAQQLPLSNAQTVLRYTNLEFLLQGILVSIEPALHFSVNRVKEKSRPPSKGLISLKEQCAGLPKNTKLEQHSCKKIISSNNRNQRKHVLY